MGFFSKLAGIIGATLQIDVVNGGFRLKNNAGVAEARNAADSAYALARAGGVTLPIGQNDLRPWSAFSVTYYVDPLNGSDANPGTQASPFQTWNGGAWPAIAALSYVSVTVNYVGTTLDTSVGGHTYILPVGVVVTLSAEWADIGTGALTSTGASTTSALVVTGGGLTVNTAKGTRIRFTSGALSGQVYSGLSNTATTITPSRAGFASAPANTDGFVLERPAGGWSPAALVLLGADAPGSSWRFSGFLYKPTNSAAHLRGGGTWAAVGLMFDQNGTTASFSPGGSVTLGQLNRDDVTNGVMDSLGSPNNLGCYIKGGGASVFVGAASYPSMQSLIAVDLTLDNGAVILQGTYVWIKGIDLYGTGAAQEIILKKAVVTLASGMQHDAATVVPLQLDQCQSVIATFAFDATLTVDAILARGGDLRVSGLTGGNAGAAGKYGLVMQFGCVCQNALGNTIVQGAGAVHVGAHAALGAWPGASALTTDLADATPQACVLWSA